MVMLPLGSHIASNHSCLFSFQAFVACLHAMAGLNFIKSEFLLEEVILAPT
jgi:hypothetical protein